ncbi:hypothetical protein DL768_011414 [Monosporascus sp. mg162]|nr:hypothetical protein DL768_011414 [Monosporascus sp. mg162]
MMCGPSGKFLVKPAPNGLALLRTCRRARIEIGDTWLGEVLFDFEDAYEMSRKLLLVPIAKLSLIRHVRVLAQAFSSRFRRGLVLALPFSLGLLPRGLQLDTFTILLGTGAATAYRIIGELIRWSGGWKEMRFVSETSELLAYTPPPSSRQWLPDYLKRSPQPATWRDVLSRRNGPSPSPTVTIYRSTKAGEVGSVMNENSRTVGNGIVDDDSLMTEGEWNKEVLIVVRRGQGVDVSRKPSSYPSTDLVGHRDELALFEARYTGGTKPVVDVYRDNDEYTYSSAVW